MATDASLTTDGLRALFDAFNRHDADAVMEFFDADCVFSAVGGDEVHGSRYATPEAIRAAFSGVWAAMPDARWDHYDHFVHGDRAVSQWVFTGTNSDGRRIEADGCDLFRLRAGKIIEKNAFRKQRPLIDVK
jgi:ketosteroid isomerase-like protein